MAVPQLALHDDDQWQGTDVSTPLFTKSALQRQGTGVRNAIQKPGRAQMSAVISSISALQQQGTGVRNAIQKPGRAQMSAVVSSMSTQL